MSRGLGSPRVDKELAREIARLGGVAAHKRGTAHEWTSAEARIAGRKGGIASAQARRAKQQAEDARA
jgi:general stress protein YciG